MDSEIAHVSAQLPLMSCWRLGTFWTGFLRFNDKLLRLTITAPKFPTIKDLTLEGDEELKAICRPAMGEIEQLIAEGLSLSDFASRFQATLKDQMENQIQTNANHNPTVPSIILNPEFYTGLLEEFNQIGHEQISYVSNDYCEIHVTHLDSDGREHVLRFYLSARYPYASLKVMADLPVEGPGSIVWPNKFSEATKQFKSEVAKYTDFWNEMQQLDETRVIDPARPNLSHTYRRILIDEKIVLHLTVNPLKPRQYPDIQITGPEKPVNNLLDLLRTKSNMWSESKSVLNNLQNILEIQFLPKICADDDKANEETDLNCTICYMYELEGEVPERTCVCSAAFHNRCLYDLYVSDFLGTGKRYIDCPVCSEEMKIMVTYS